MHFYFKALSSQEFKAHSGSKRSQVHFVEESRVITIDCKIL